MERQGKIAEMFSKILINRPNAITGLVDIISNLAASDKSLKLAQVQKRGIPMLPRSFFRSLFWMNLATDGSLAGKRVAPMESKICFFAFLFVFVLISSRGQAQLSVDGTADPSVILWGHESDISAIASGGTPPYLYGFAPYCSGSQPPIFIAYAIPNSNQFELCGERTGLWSIICEATDSSGPPNNVAQDTVFVEVLDPNKIVILGSLFEGNFVFDGQQVLAGKNLEFEVRRNTEKMGDCAKACVQTKIWEPPSTEAETEWDPLNCDQVGDYTLAWGPPTVDQNVSFTVSLIEWNAAAELDVLGAKFIRIRLNYLECNGAQDHLLSNLYRVDFRKKTDTVGQIVVSRSAQ